MSCTKVRLFFYLCRLTMVIQWLRKLRKEVHAIITSTKTIRARDMVPYTYGEIRDLYKNFAGDPNELRMLMDFTALRKADAKFLLDNLKADIGRRKSA